MDAGAGLEVMFLHRAFAGDQHGGGAIAVLAGNPGGDDPAFLYGAQAREAFGSGGGSDGLVRRQFGHRRDLVGEPAVVGSGLRTLVAGGGELFHLGAGDAPLRRDHFG